jgi:hypothetical protein
MKTRLEEKSMLSRLAGERRAGKPGHVLRREGVERAGLDLIKRHQNGIGVERISKDSRNKLQKKSDEQQAEAADEETRHPGSSAAFGDQGKKQRNKPHE